MKTRKSLGDLIRSQREARGLTQRDLAQMLGVKASHIAYLESEMRRPSFTLVGKLASALELDKQELLLLAHPEARHLVGDEARGNRGNAWERFQANKAILAQNAVSPAEMKILKQVNSLGKVNSPKQFLFVLNAIRHALLEE